MNENKISPIMEGSGIARRNYRNTAVTMPLLGFGGMRLPQKDGAIDYDEVRRMVETAMRSGCNYFDTAYMYHDGKSEVCLGEVLSAYPRESYYLTDKMPVWMAEDEDGMKAIFEEQLKRCKTAYFDNYLLHSLDADHWATAQKFHAYEFLTQMKKAGKIRRLGFSFHDSPEVLQKIVDAREWDFAQIQLNYLDWDLYHSREQYEILTEAGSPVIVMEPLRGGALATLSPDSAAILQAAEPGKSCASWGLRYVASLPNVLCLLSGMSSLPQIEDNMETFRHFVPLTNQERETLTRALNVYRKQLAVPCTSCRYCMPCPAGVDIPRIFGIYNQFKVTGSRWHFDACYQLIPESSQATACVNCRQCMSRCPQKLHIPDLLKSIAGEMK